MNTTTHEVAEKIRQEPFHVFSLRNNCIGKSFKFKRVCHLEGIDARVVISLGLAHNKRYKFLPPIILSVHGWVEVRNHKIRLVRTKDGLNFWGTKWSDERPLIVIRI